MGYSLNTDNVDPDHINTIPQTEPGLYHFQVESWDDNESKEFINLILTIVGSEQGKESAIGKKHREMIFYSEKQKQWADKKINALFVAVGEFSLEDVKAMKSKKMEIAPDFDNIIGKTFVGRLERSKDKDGKETNYNNLNFSYYTLDSEEAKSVNLNQAVINNPDAVIGSEDDEIPF